VAWFNRFVACTLASLLLGCAALSSYPEPGRKRPDTLTALEEPSVRTKPVSVDEAIAYGRSIEDAYRQQARKLSATRTGANLGITGTALSAIGVAMTGGASTAIQALTLSGVGLALGSRQVAVATYRTIYTMGADAIECSIVKVWNAPPVEREADRGAREQTAWSWPCETGRCGRERRERTNTSDALRSAIGWSGSSRHARHASAFRQRAVALDPLAMWRCALRADRIRSTARSPARPDLFRCAERRSQTSSGVLAPSS
jgi:hypothetical protein